MGKFKDTRSAGRSRHVPWIQGESKGERHLRRKESAEGMRQKFEFWCKEHGLRLRVGNEGHHWHISGLNMIFEWYPSSAKFVIMKRYQEGVHCHDVEQAMREISQYLPNPKGGK